MAAFVLFMLAVAGGVVVADLVWGNPAAGQVTMFHQTIGGYRGVCVAAWVGRSSAMTGRSPAGRQRSAD